MADLKREEKLNAEVLKVVSQMTDSTYDYHNLIPVVRDYILYGVWNGPKRGVL